MTDTERNTTVNDTTDEGARASHKVARKVARVATKNGHPYGWRGSYAVARGLLTDGGLTDAGWLELTSRAPHGSHPERVALVRATGRVLGLY